jgi:CRISPR-associated protein Cas5d
MSYGIKLKIFGDYACFTRPEMKVERVSYDVITPSAARGILEAIYWKPSIRWIINKIHILKPIQFTNIRRNEVSKKISSTNIKAVINGTDLPLYLVSSQGKIRQQRAALVLRDVCYVIEAYFEITDQANTEETQEKHYSIALRRIRKGQYFHQPYLGTREFAANYEILEDELPKGFYSDKGKMDLGWMLWDIDFQNGMTPIFYRALMQDGVIDVQDLLKVR